MSELVMPDDPESWQSFGGMLLEPRLTWVRPFQMDATEVTRRQYREFLEATGYRPPFVDEAWANEGWNWNGTIPPAGTEDHPVVLVNWYDATEFCAWAEKRLPTEAEWQRAALGKREDKKLFPWGTQYDGQKMNHGKMDEPNFDDSDGWLYTSPAGQYPQGRSQEGIDDLFGNAWEFTADWRKDDWDDATGTLDEHGWLDLQMQGPGLYVAVRGAAYFFDISPNPAGERNHFLPELRRKTSGFRCAQ
jgi:formylglycine-generating enzyme required for sulfatase activity